jgi:predicted aspartyl protease
MSCLAIDSFRLACESRQIPLVGVMVDGRGPFDFGLDTAATKSVLAIDLARELGYEVSTPPAGESLMALRGMPLMIGSLAVAGVREGSVQVAVADLEVLVNQLKTSIRGIIGFDFLSSRRITIDYRSHTLTIE